MLINMKKQKGYVVLEVGYDYNDEVYHTGNYGAMYEAPNKVYLDKDIAEEEVVKRTCEKLRGLPLGAYGYGIEEIAKKGCVERLSQICEEIGFNIEDGDDVPKKATDKQLQNILELIDLEFFTIVEVEIN